MLQLDGARAPTRAKRLISAPGAITGGVPPQKTPHGPRRGDLKGLGGATDSVACWWQELTENFDRRLILAEHCCEIMAASGIF
jgi:hypothetical protein